MWNIVQRNKQLASSHSLSLIFALFLLLLPLNLSPLSFLPHSVLPLVLAQTLIVSSQIKKGLTISFFYMIQLSLICSEWIMHCVTHGVTEMYFQEYSQCFSDFHKLQIILLSEKMHYICYKWCFRCDVVKAVNTSYSLFQNFIFVINLGQFVEICLHFCFCFLQSSICFCQCKKTWLHSLWFRSPRWAKYFL